MNTKNTRRLGLESLEGRDLLSGMGMLVPAYIDPSDNPAAWTQLNQAASQVSLVAIANPYGGPVSGANAGYNAATDNLHAAGGKAIGYVATTYGAKSLAQVQTEINGYRDRFHVDGIFLDEVQADAAHLAYYQQIYNYIHTTRPQWTVVGNPGTNVPESYLTTKVADTLVTFEDESGYAQHTTPTWQANYDAKNFANLVLNIPTATEMQADVTRAASQHTGWMYVTNDSQNSADGDPWNSLPSYFGQLVTAVKAANVTPTATAPTITTASLANGTVSTAYSQTIVTTGGTGTKTFSLSGGSLPNGLGLSATTGTISGTPTTAGTFNFTVKVTDAAGATASKSFSVTMSPAAAPVVAPTAPGNFTVTAISSSQIRLTWSDGANETGYRIYRWNGVTASWQVANTAAANTTTFTDSGLAANTTYFYYVEAFNTAGSASVAYKTATTPTAAPAAPSNFSATPVSSSQIRVSWTASPGATGYRVYKWTGSDWAVTATLGSTATTFTQTGLASKTGYFFYVEAFNSYGSAATGWQLATTF
jgi:hypothetical protein